MEKILEIASSITDPVSLTALLFLVLYLLFKGVIAKVGKQEGESGNQLLKRLMSMVAIVAIVTILVVFGFKAYEVYNKVADVPELTEIISQLDNNEEQLNETTDTIVKATTALSGQLQDSGDAIIEETEEIQDDIEEATTDLTKTINESAETIIKQVNKEELTVKFSLEKFTGGNLYIGNTGGQIILMKNLKMHWDYEECTSFDPIIMASLLAEFRYSVSITKELGSELIDAKEFSYGAGDIDKFLIAIDYPGLGVYSVWITFEYNIFGTDDWFLYETDKSVIKECEKKPF